MTTTTLELRPSAPRQVGTPLVDLVIPVYNEERILEDSVLRVHRFLAESFPYPTRITIADNASVDSTWTVARYLAETLPGVRAVHLEAKGRGRALRTVWLASEAPVLAYMDVDLSTDLAALAPLVAPLLSGHSQVAIGSRLSRSSRVVRGAKREFISRSYNLLLRGSLAARFSDAQCGFKAVRADAARELLPAVEDDEWFFDTEMLIQAQRAGMRIHEVPVDWVDDPDSRVDIGSTARKDLQGIARMWRTPAPRPWTGVGAALAGGLDGVSGPAAADDGSPLGVSASEGIPRASRAHPDRPALPFQLLSFALIGGLSTLAYLAIFAVLRAPIGAQWANFVALGLTAIANTAANRRMTFGIRTSRRRMVHQGEGLIVFAVGWAITSGSLALLGALAPGAGTLVEMAVLVAANLTATVARFVLLSRWVFAR